MHQKYIPALLVLSVLMVRCTIPGTESSIESTLITPTSLPAVTESVRFLQIVSPSEDANFSGGADLHVNFLTTDDQGQYADGVVVTVELLSPDGAVYFSESCSHKGQGLHGCPPMTLPIRGAEGIWRLRAEASWNSGQTALTETTFHVNPSVSELYLDRYGFWIEYPQVFGLGTGFYNLSETGGLHFEDWVNEDDSGFVILNNYLYHSIGITFATIEVHWQDADYPEDENAAITFVEELSSQGLHHQDPDIPVVVLSAEVVEFQALRAWEVQGEGSEYYVAKPAAAYPIEWMIFNCPDSEWLWTVVLFTDDEAYLDHLRTIRDTFQCPSDSNS